MEFVPSHGIGAQGKMIGGVVDGDIDHTFSQMRYDTTAPNGGGCLQFDASGDTIPVALCLVGHAVRVLTHADVLDAVVDTDGNGVIGTEADILRYVVAVGDRERHVMANLLTVDENGGLDVWTLQKECDALMLHRRRDKDAVTIPGTTGVVAVGRQKERELHHAVVPVFLHIGIEIEAGVVERSRP